MVIDPHDLVEIDTKNLISHTPIPDWAIESLSVAPYVVVRRAHAPSGQIAIGIRGKSRGERFAAFLPEHAIIRQLKPEHLTGKHLLKYRQSPVFVSLEIAGEILDRYNLVWGPGGSAGFELASGVETVTAKSDLDLIVRAINPIPINIAVKILSELQRCPAKADVQVETAEGAFSLVEYAKNSFPILLKTQYGPLLIENPWVNSLATSNFAYEI
jgi:phosphoribosyl-dephospho-CoA transferase